MTANEQVDPVFHASISHFSLKYAWCMRMIFLFTKFSLYMHCILKLFLCNVIIGLMVTITLGREELEVVTESQIPSLKNYLLI